jgi:hypothetical protein
MVARLARDTTRFPRQGRQCRSRTTDLTAIVPGIPHRLVVLRR